MSPELKEALREGAYGDYLRDIRIEQEAAQ